MTYLLPLLFVIGLCLLIYLLLKGRKNMASHPSRPNKPEVVGPPTRSLVETSTTKTIEFPKAVKVTIAVKRDDKGNPVLIAEPREVSVEDDVQVAWTCREGKLEIRFNPANKPFVGDSYEAGRGGIIYSGPLVRTPSPQPAYTYTALVTTKDGVFVTQTFAVKVNRKDGYK